MGILGGHNLTKSLHDLQKRVFGIVTDTQTDRWTSRLVGCEKAVKRPKGRFSKKLFLQNIYDLDICYW